MITLVYDKMGGEILYPEDVDRLVSIAYDRGFLVSRKDAQEAWDSYSESRCAGWLILRGDDDQIFNNMYQYLREE